MNDMESRLTELLKAGVGDPPSPVTVQAVRHERARRRVVAVLRVAAAVSVLAAVSVGLLVRLGNQGKPVGSTVPAGVPRYYVQEGTSQGLLKTVVRATATGLVTDTVRCPWQSAAPWIYPIAADGHQRFFMVCTSNDHQSPTEARIYQFRVTSSGQANDYGLIPGGKLGAVSVGTMAVSPDGSQVAVIVSPPGTGPATTPRAEILVIDTRSGAHAIWRNASATRHASRFRIFDVSFAAGGREVVFLGTRTCGPGNNPALCRPGDQQVRALSPAADGGLLNAGQLLLQRTERGPARQITDIAVSADGSTLTIVTVSVPPRPLPSTVTVSQMPIGTRRQRVIYQIHGSSRLEPDVFFSTDSSGRHFLINAGTSTHPADGWINNGKLVKLKPSGNLVSYEAW
jgi:hypothetical protein